MTRLERNLLRLQYDQALNYAFGLVGLSCDEHQLALLVDAKQAKECQRNAQRLGELAREAFSEADEINARLLQLEDAPAIYSHF